ncbi:MAG: TlpA family protein disulfide reductase [Planctomycetota bacterium]|jgi:thiol-disulfide isomerase/thioredoxin
MPRFNTAAALVLVTLSLAACAGGPGVGAAAPAFQAEDTHGTVVSMGTLEGKVVVLDFWATWCAPCREASPHVQKLYERLADNDDVVMLAIHFDGEGDPAGYMAEHKYTFPVVPDGTDVVEAYGIKRIPTFIVIDRSGTIVFKHVGFTAPSDLNAVFHAVNRSL